MAYFGIDLGTTNTVITAFQQDPISGNSKYSLVPIIYPNNTDNITRYKLPSVAFSTTDGKWTVGEMAEQTMAELGEENGHFYSNMKAGLEGSGNGGLPQKVMEELLTVCFYSIHQYFINYFKAIGIDSPEMAWNGFRTSTFGISNPLATKSSFTNNLNNAAYAAGYRVQLTKDVIDKKVFIYEEPKAALQNFIIRDFSRPSDEAFFKPGKQYIAMVIDLGGGTTDVSIRPFYLDKDGKLTKPIFLNTCLSKNNNIIRAQNNAKSAFGGMDFDNLLTAFVARKINDVYVEEGMSPFLLGPGYNRYAIFDESMDFDHSISPDIQNRIKSRCRALAIELKEHFSKPENNFYESARLRTLLSSNDMTLAKVEVTREEYANIIRRLIEVNSALATGHGVERDSIEGIITKTYEAAHVKDLSDLDVIYLTGGMSNVCEIRDWLSRHVNGKCKIVWAEEDIRQNEHMSNCFIDISYGISRAGAMGENKGLDLAYDIMLDLGGKPEVIVENSHKCPDSWVTESYPVKSVVGIPIRLLAGDGPYGTDLTVELECVLAKGRIIRPGSTLYFKCYLDANKQASLTVVYTDINGVEHEEELDLLTKN